MTRRIRRTGNPRGAPRKLTPAQERRLFATVEAAPVTLRFAVYADWANELHVCEETLKRSVTRSRQEARA